MDPQTKAFQKKKTTHNMVRGLLHFSKRVFYFIQNCLVNTRTISSYCTRAHGHVRLTWEPRDTATHIRYIYEHLLWVFQFGYMSYFMGLKVP